MKIVKRIHTPRLEYMRTFADMQRWLRQYDDAELSVMDPMRGTCCICGALNIVPRLLAERYQDFDCQVCGAKTPVGAVIPDAGRLCRLGAAPFLTTLYFN